MHLPGTRIAACTPCITTGASGTDARVGVLEAEHPHGVDRRDRGDFGDSGAKEGSSISNISTPACHRLPLMGTCLLYTSTTVLGFFVIVYTVLVALGQLKEMTRTRHLEAMLRVYDIIGSHEARIQRRFIYTQLTSPPYQLSSEERDHIEDVSASFDRIGKLIEDGLVPRDMLFDSHCEMIIRCWIKLKPYIILPGKCF